MSNPSSVPNTKINTMFWVHLFVTALSWVGPFFFSWYLIIAAYMVVYLQFALFNRCLMNAGHDLPEEDDNTFYGYLLAQLGYRPDKAKLKFFVRKIIYIILTAITIIWQLVLGFPPLLF